MLFLVLITTVVSLVLSGNVLAHGPAKDMADAASAFLSTLKDGQRARAVLPLTDPERENWHFFPKARQGLPLRDMDARQRAAATGLLASALSARGLEKSTNIMQLESILREIEGPAAQGRRDSGLYYFTIFGEPDPRGTWGWRVEGHHLSLNFTIVKGGFFAVTPSFLGANPAKVQRGPQQGLRVLAAEEDLARNLVKSLTESQRTKAIIRAQAPADIITGAQRHVTPLETAGIRMPDLTSSQRDQLMELIREYVFRHRRELAEDDLNKIKQAGEDRIQFAWAGGLEPGEGHYYRVQGPTFLLEYDNTQNQANHIHTVWRDFENDFGQDLLRQHYDQAHR